MRTRDIVVNHMSGFSDASGGFHMSGLNDEATCVTPPVCKLQEHLRKSFVFTTQNMAYVIKMKMSWVLASAPNTPSEAASAVSSPIRSGGNWSHRRVS
jgi:hypothetical protein